MDYLFNTEKIKYVKGQKPKVECILCAIRDKDPVVQSLEVCRKGGCIISVNLYPFNPGHVMIFPERHVADLNGLTDEEALGMHRLLCVTVDILKEEFNPSGFNIGYNLGNGSGASIPHVHQHIVPRYDNEVGFLDVLAGTRVVVVDPVEVMNRLKERFKSITTAL
ncbi:MAG TPA: HIT domain-containing protein [Spirochaetota bacterium]|nr:HIT domain-containing protein [Spirochaetota bacterium]HPR48281.1 HIT domain-containing protein [Spirochaetota bacterium]